MTQINRNSSSNQNTHTWLFNSAHLPLESHKLIFHLRSSKYLFLRPNQGTPDPWAKLKLKLSPFALCATATTLLVNTPHNHPTKHMTRLCLHPCLHPQFQQWVWPLPLTKMLGNKPPSKVSTTPNDLPPNPPMTWQWCLHTHFYSINHDSQPQHQTTPRKHANTDHWTCTISYTLDSWLSYITTASQISSYKPVNDSSTRPQSLIKMKTTTIFTAYTIEAIGRALDLHGSPSPPDRASYLTEWEQPSPHFDRGHPQADPAEREKLRSPVQERWAWF